MLVKHLRKDFYENVIGKRVLLIVNADVDSVCTTKILLELFRVDGVSYSLLIVDGYGTLKSKFLDAANGMPIILMVNIGAAVDILQMLGNSPDKIFYIMDNHRPIHIANYYNETNQVRLLTLDETVQVPAFDDLFVPDVSDSENDEENMGEDSENEDQDEEESAEILALIGKRKRSRNPRQRKKDRSDWTNRRNDLLFKYTQYCSFALPSALIALELSWSKSRDDTQFVWWAIVALTDSYVMNRMSRHDYTLKAAELHAHIARISHSRTAPRDCLKVAFENELCFFLYRHWNLYDSMKMTPYSAATLKTWSLKGEQRFHELLGELGLPLTQCKQKFTSMDLQLRRTIKETFSNEDVRDKYKFDMITVGSFVAEIGFRAKYSAFDSQLATLALLENPDKSLSISEKFLESLECLSKNRRTTLDKGLALAKIFMEAMFRQVQAMINTHAIGPRGEYLHADIAEGAPDVCYFKSPSSLLMLAQFIQQAIIATCRSRRWVTMPVVVTCPHDLDWWSVVGIRPQSNEVTDNMFGKIFEALAQRMPDTILLDACDPNIVLVRREDRHKFLELLEACLV